MPASVLLFAVTWGGLSPEAALERALDAVEPPPALRATFRATLASGSAVRRIEYDPYAPADQQFKVTMAYGEDEELDAVVQGWKDEGQADCRIFADDIRADKGGRIERQFSDAPCAPDVRCAATKSRGRRAHPGSATLRSDPGREFTILGRFVVIEQRVFCEGS